MKTNLHSKPGDKARLFVPVTGFKFASYPVRINHISKCVSGVAILQTKSHNLLPRLFER
jgi:hypothetical protein